MNPTILIISAIVTGIICLLLGIMLGCLFGKTGSIYVLSFILRIPLFLIKSPESIKNFWKMWRELKASEKNERLKKQKRIDELKKNIPGLKAEIRKIKKQIRSLKWGAGGVGEKS